MKFLTDQDVWAATVALLRAHGHDVVTAAEAGLARVADQDLLRAAQAEPRLLVTRDRDFGRLVYRSQLGRGVIYLRVTPSDMTFVHKELVHLLATHSETELRQAFVVVEPGRYRLRHLPP